MNILPKKRWHVRTKDNIARVRRDEAEAREQEKIQQEKLNLAESEARINFLRKKQLSVSECQTREENESTQSVVATDTNTTSHIEIQQHVDLFSDYKLHIKTTNKSHALEKKEEQEKYEKQIGYLTYLGQDTNEALKLRSWYEVAPKRAKVGDANVIEKDLKNKHTNDPLTLINALLPPEKLPASITARKRKRSPLLVVDRSTASPEKISKKARVSEDLPKKNKHKKEKKHGHKEKRNKKDKKKSKEKHSSTFRDEEKQRKKDMLEKLRKERLHREATERARQEALLAPKETKEIPTTRKETTPRIVQKYNSQFNPELAKQNML